MKRRRFLHLVANAIAVSTVSRFAKAQAYPTRPVRLIVNVAAGGGVDIVARMIAQRLSDRLGQPFVVENRPGAGGNIGTEAVVRAAPDGYTLLVVVAANAINVTLYDRLSFNFIRDIAPISEIYRTPLFMVVNPSFPVKTVPEFIAYAKANPGKINMASAGNGTVQHVAGELFKMMTSINMVHVPYREGVASVTDLLGGQVQVMFHTTGAAISYIRAGQLRPLAVTTPTRQEVLPDIPTVGEFVPGYEASGWMGIGAPRTTPAEIIDRLNGEINASLADSKIRERIADLGNTTSGGSPGDFARLIAAETEKWAKVVKFSGARAD
jgi:tripartite-type tricarboxylate transporter receptor subunit TctC